MRRFISQPHKSVSFGGKPSSGPSPLELQDSYRGKGFSAAAETRPLLWQDYFPHSFDQWDCDITQPVTNVAHRAIQESLETSENCLIVDRFKRNRTKRTHKKESYNDFIEQLEAFLPKFSKGFGSNTVLNLSNDVSSPYPSGCGKRKMDMINILNALDMVDEVEDPLSANDFICILLKCKTRKDLVLAKRVHAHIRGNSLDTHIAVGNHLVPVFVECGSVSDAQEAFDRLPLRNVYSWTSLLTGYIQSGKLAHALNLYEKMQAEGVLPNSYTLVTLVKVCTALRDMKRGQKIYRQAVELGFERELIVGSALIDMYTKSHLLAEAQMVFDKLWSRNVVVWSVLTEGYAGLGEGQAALDCFERMQVEGIIPNSVTYISVLKACRSAGLISKGQSIHTDIVRKGFDRDLFLGNTLIDMYAKGGSLLDARGVFDELLAPDVSSWNVMIQGYSLNHGNDLALQLFESMCSLGTKPDAITFACILSACGRADSLCKGQELFSIMQEVYGILPSADHLNCMVDLLARAGRVCEADWLLDSSPSSSSLDTWRSLLSACTNFAEIEIGERCFCQLVQMNPECAAPYVLMGTIYERAGRWEDANRIKELRKQSREGGPFYVLRTQQAAFRQERNVD